MVWKSLLPNNAITLKSPTENARAIPRANPNSTLRPGKVTAKNFLAPTKPNDLLRALCLDSKLNNLGSIMRTTKGKHKKTFDNTRISHDIATTSANFRNTINSAVPRTIAGIAKYINIELSINPRKKFLPKKLEPLRITFE